jgi:hypothetical protein
MVAEVILREQRMRAAFGQWDGRILMNPHLSRHLRLKFFNLIVIPNGVYGCATWNLCKKQIKHLESIQLWMLKKVCGIHTDKRSSYKDVLRITARAGCPFVPLGCTVARLQLRYLGHVERMGQHRVQKQIMYGRLVPTLGKKRRGAPARNFRVAVTDALRDFGLSPQNWQFLASNRSEWRQLLNSSGKEHAITQWCSRKDKETDQRHEREAARVVPDGDAVEMGAIPVLQASGGDARRPLLPISRNRRKNVLRDARRRRKNS